MKISLKWLCIIAVANCTKFSLDTPVSDIKDLQTLEYFLQNGKIPVHCVAISTDKVRVRTSCDIWLAERNCVGLLEVLANGNPGYFIDGDVLHHAALKGSLESLKWAWSRKANFATADALMFTAIEAGHETVARWLSVTFNIFPTTSSIETAAVRGHLGILKWILETFQRQFVSEDVMDLAVEGAQWHIVTWLVETANIKQSRTSHICMLSQQGNLDQLQLKYQQGDFPSQKAANCAASSGQILVLEWLYKADGTLPNNVHSICKNGHLTVLIWLHKNGSSSFAGLAALAASHGHVDILDWLYSTFKVMPDTFALALATEGQHLAVLEWTLAKDATLLASEIIADAAARHGYAKLLKWIHVHCHGPSEDGLLDAAYGAHLDVLADMHSRRSVCSQELVDQAAISSRRVDKFAVLDWLYPTCKLLPTQYNDLEVGRWIEEVSKAKTLPLKESIKLEL